ncbi:DeoR/GlpR family DNA-binding transcription regulator [Arthrobacter sp. USHLN218]|uniref:DeoR/GlpR family DNA-binding transcription regulator n=1 Tax=Arthrobacter sp. USHLN218 TaxID=3081232 RepID=UPI00301A926F
MFAAERHRLIGALVDTQGRVTVGELADKFDITKETVRRDLAMLEELSQLRRVHGGAVAVHKASTSEQSLDTRQLQRHDEKLRIARQALALVPAGAASAVIDAGTTTELLAELLTSEPNGRHDDLLVITHAVPIAYRISTGSQLQLEMVGGRVRGLTSAGIGAATLERFAALRPDIAFIGANGIHASFGLSTPDPLEAAVKTAIVRSARRVVALIDSSKLDEETLVRFAGLEEIDTLITDKEPAGPLAGALEQADVEVVVA